MKDFWQRDGYFLIETHKEKEESIYIINFGKEMMHQFSFTALFPISIVNSITSNNKNLNHTLYLTLLLHRFIILGHQVLSVSWKMVLDGCFVSLCRYIFWSSSDVTFEALKMKQGQENQSQENLYLFVSL